MNSTTNWPALILRCHQQLLGKSLTPPDLDAEAAVRWLQDDAPFCVLAHDASADPRYVWANAASLRCFGYTEQEFIGLPSRFSADTPQRGEREALLAQVAARGYATNYRGLRISKTGERFWIEDVTVWNLLDANGVYIGQAASYPRITPVTS